MPYRFFVVLGLLLFTSIGKAGVIAEKAPLPSTEALVAQFDAVVFGNEHDNNSDVVRKWRHDPRVAFFASPEVETAPPFDEMRAHLRRLAALTGLHFPPAESLNSATLKVGFYPRRDFSALPGNGEIYEGFVQTSACLGVAVNEPSSASAIRGGAILIGSDIPSELQRHCIVEEMVQMMGLPNDACHYRPSLFCEGDRVDAMTPADELLLRALYDRRLAFGADRQTALAVVGSILGEMRSGLVVKGLP